jgi:hypothetical protein
MFIDWLYCYQDYDYQLPVISDDGYAHFDFTEGAFGQIRQSRVVHEGSYSTSISVHVRNNRIVVEGNPSRYNRLDNLFGYTTLEQCFTVYNSILSLLGLPVMSKCTVLGYTDYLDGKAPKALVDGAVITRLDGTTNMAVGGGNCVDSYLKALSTMPYRRSRGNLYADGKTCDWKSILGNAREIYACVYHKAHEFSIHLLPKVKRAFGEQSPEYAYILQLIDYCRTAGVTRHEQKFKSAYLNKHNLQFYGLSDTLNQLTNLHNEFLNIDKKLKVSAMDLRTITQTLIEEGICDNTKAANTTALYAINWMNGDTFESHKKQVQIHRAHLRKIGIDILKPCNLLLFSPVIVKEVIEITRTELQPPSFYKHAQLPNHLRLVA